MATRRQIKPNDKEMAAVKFNMVEQRCLRKNLAILDAEASYSLKLIDLNNRGMKIFYKRFKNKVGKIKSNLKKDEISDLQDLDSKGMLDDLIKPLNLTGALRIADAEKRLKLQCTYSTRKARSALPVSKSHTGIISRPAQDRPNTCIGNVTISQSTRGKNDDRKLSLQKSTTSLDIVQEPTTQIHPVISPDSRSKQELQSNHPQREVRRRSSSKQIINMDSRNSAQFITSPLHKPDHSPRSPRSLYAVEGQKTLHNSQKINTMETKMSPNSLTNKNEYHDFNIPEVKIPEDKFTSEVHKEKEMKSEEHSSTEVERKHVKISGDANENNKHYPDKRSMSRVSTFAKASATSGGGGGGGGNVRHYSCHTMPERKRERSNSIKVSYIQVQEDDVFTGYLGDSPYEERRKMLLSQEEMASMELLDRKDDFMDNLDAYIKQQLEKQSAPVKTGINSENLPASNTGFDITELSRRQKKMMSVKRRTTIDSKRAAELWKDVNKCRYLRVAEDKIDLSGLVVLAKDQMKLGKVI